MSNQDSQDFRDEQDFDELSQGGNQDLQDFRDEQDFDELS